jgi:hypothetical protein
MLRKVLPLLGVSSLAIFSILITGCGSSSPAIGVSVDASRTTVDGAGTNAVTLTATVTHDPTSKGVTWTSSAGTLSDATTTSVKFSPPAATSSVQLVVVTATSAADTSKSGNVTITVPAALSVTNDDITALNGAVGPGYSVRIQASGGIPPYKNFAVAAGSSLPSCLTLNSSTGVITFTDDAGQAACAANSPYDPAFTFEDSGTPTPLTGTSPDYVITITPAPALTLPLPSATVPGPAGTAGTPYSGSVQGSGGAGTLTYELTRGALPSGLTLDAHSGAITGTANRAGTYDFTVRVSDAYGDKPLGQSYSLVINPAPVHDLTLEAPSNTTAGAGFSLTVTAEDAYGNTVTTYGGTVSFRSNDNGAVLPTSYAFTPADNGQKTFTGVKLETAGSRSVTATDGGGITGSATVEVSAAEVSRFELTASAADAVAGAPFDVTVAAEDPYGNATPSYTGTVHFTSSDTDSHVVLPSDYTFQEGDSGVHTFTGVKLATASESGQWIKATDTVVSSIEGTVTVNVTVPTYELPTSDPPEAIVNGLYHATITATVTNGSGHYTWLVGDDQIPGGGFQYYLGSDGLASRFALSHNSTTVLNLDGIPDSTGSVQFTVRIRDTDNMMTSAPHTYTITVSAGGTVSGQFSMSDYCMNGSNTLPVTFTVTLTDYDDATNIYTTTTDSHGDYSLSGIRYGTYSLVPSIPGAASSMFSPWLYPYVTFDATNSTITGKNFGAKVGYNVSGTVTYNGTLTGQTYLSLKRNNCGSGSGLPGTSISANDLSSGGGGFTIHGVEPGDYTLNAWMDGDGVTATNNTNFTGYATTGGVYNGPQGVRNANNPTGSATGITVTDAGLTGKSITLSDPAFNTPSKSPEIQVVPGAGGVLIFYNPPSNNNVEEANAYLVQWSEGNSRDGGVGGFSNVAGSRVFFAAGNGTPLWILNNTVTGTNSFIAGRGYYFQVLAYNFLADTASASWSTFESGGSPLEVTIPATNTFCVSDCTTVDATVNIPAGVTINAGAPLYVGFYQQSAGSDGPTAIYAAQVASPAAGDNTVSITIPSGSDYHLFGILDQNNDGQIDAYDVTNVRNDNSNALTFDGSATSASTTLPSAASKASVRTKYSQLTSSGSTTSSYSYNLEVDEANKLPVGVTLSAAPNMLYPVDLSLCTECGGGVRYEYDPIFAGAVPDVGDTFFFTVKYSDGTTEEAGPSGVSGTVSAWDSVNGGYGVTGPNSLPTSLSPIGEGSVVNPEFDWTFPLNPSDFYYSFFLSQSDNCTGNCNVWQIPGEHTNSVGFTYDETAIAPTYGRILWGIDPTGAGSSPTGTLDPSSTYQWGITVEDSTGNTAQQTVTFKP